MCTWIQSLPACRCFGLLISPGKDVKNSEMNLLDNMVGCSHQCVYMYISCTCTCLLTCTCTSYNVHVHVYLILLSMTGIDVGTGMFPPGIVLLEYFCKTINFLEYLATCTYNYCSRYTCTYRGIPGNQVSTQEPNFKGSLLQ